MKKPSSLAQQINQAKRTIESWPESRVSTLRLEGVDIFKNQRPSGQSGHQQTETCSKKKVVA